MNKPDEHSQPEAKPEAKPETTRTTRDYFFPNGGDVPAFSCQAESQEEAEKLNDQHIKENS
jgi:hypothetical protein